MLSFLLGLGLFLFNGFTALVYVRTFKLYVVAVVGNKLVPHTRGHFRARLNRAHARLGDDVGDCSASRCFLFALCGKQVTGSLYGCPGFTFTVFFLLRCNLRRGNLSRAQQLLALLLPVCLPCFLLLRHVGSFFVLRCCAKHVLLSLEDRLCLACRFFLWPRIKQITLHTFAFTRQQRNRLVYRGGLTVNVLLGQCLDIVDRLTSGQSGGFLRKRPSLVIDTSSQILQEFGFASLKHADSFFAVLARQCQGGVHPALNTGPLGEHLRLHPATLASLLKSVTPVKLGVCQVVNQRRVKVAQQWAVDLHERLKYFFSSFTLFFGDKVKPILRFA